MTDYTHELDYWDSPINQWVEMGRHYVYAEKMGLRVENYWFRVHGKSVLDIGGGPCSMLLQTWDAGVSVVVDPSPYPTWVIDRYTKRRIILVPVKGEALPWIERKFDEAWIYNVLQHVEDPAIVIAEARRVANRVRIFEWIDIPPYEGHPHMLTKKGLDAWLDIDGTVETVSSEPWLIQPARCYSAVKET